jgi:hypothetical protein
MHHLFWEPQMTPVTNLVTYPLKAPTIPPPFYKTLVEWPVRQKLYYFLDMQKIFFSKIFFFFLKEIDALSWIFGNIWFFFKIKQLIIRRPNKPTIQLEYVQGFLFPKCVSSSTFSTINKNQTWKTSCINTPHIPKMFKGIRKHKRRENLREVKLAQTRYQNLPHLNNQLHVRDQPWPSWGCVLKRWKSGSN